MNIPMYSALSMLVYGKALYKNIIIIIIIIRPSNLNPMLLMIRGKFRELTVSL